MRPTRRSFVVEYKGSRRRPTKQPDKIWGNTDLKTLAREAEADAPHLFAATPAPLLANEIEPVPAEPVTGASSDAGEAGPSTESAIPRPAPPTEEVSAPDAAEARSKEPRRRRVKREMIKTSSPAITDPREHSARPDETVAELYEDDDLDRLETENTRLKRLLTERLRQENDRLHGMLARFA